MNNYSDKILEIATKAHDGQYRKYGCRLPYITHPIAVANISEEILKNELKSSIMLESEINENIEIIRSIAYLHDTIEDTNLTELELIRDIQPLTSHYQFIVNNVMYLTKSNKDFDLFIYLDNIKSNLFSRIVKLADLQHNMSDLKVQKKLDYYKLVRFYLNN